MIPLRRWSLVPVLVIALTVLGTLVPLDSFRSVNAGEKAASPRPVSDSAIADGASLHNPGFDNHDWYEFNNRYQNYVTGSWIPDDDDNLDNDIPESIRQDWRLWFLNGTALVESDPEKKYAHSGEGVQMRPYDWGKGSHQVAGLYQVIHDTTPCLVYQFQMYVESYPEEEYRAAVLKVGIDQVGWDLEPAYRPAVHSFPDTMVWGIPQDYKWPNYGLVTVSAEALNTKITAFTYADAPGGRYHRVLWDTGSFQEVTPADLIDPDDPPAPSGIYSLQVSASRTSATVNWSTSGDALGQVYYRFVSGPSVPPSTETYSYTVYLPYIARPPSPWLSTELNKSATASHSQGIGNLEPGSTYEYLVVSRGLLGGECVTWVSNKQTFTTNP
jgi:hypothetical protein